MEEPDVGKPQEEKPAEQNRGKGKATEAEPEDPAPTEKGKRKIKENVKDPFQTSYPDLSD